MNLNCSAKMVKYLMISFNLFFVITGIILLGIGVTVKTAYSQYHTFLDDKYFSLPNMLIATGAIIFFVSFCGCCGALKESWLLTGIFAILLIVIFIFELSIGIAGFALKNRTYDYLEKELMSNMNYYNQSEKFVKKMWDTVQDDFKCCGVNNYSDWKNVFPYGDLPISCCPRTSAVGVFYCNSNLHMTTLSRTARQAPPALPVVSPHPEISEPNPTTVPIFKKNETTTELGATGIPFFSTTHPYKQGCAPAFSSYIKEHASDLAAVGIVLALIQILGIAFAFYLTKKLRNGYYSA
ncbi:unnamed protein product [Brassicogethes aeneus]|uniref:Tetraspanin n=1 Tax=Brassicogethes aeneus TaxID=1431903 RepID=A0A9P0B4A6_BRAAE|nr:unnamed protein product [Brassicogethes aeneus]